MQRCTVHNMDIIIIMIILVVIILANIFTSFILIIAPVTGAMSLPLSWLNYFHDLANKPIFLQYGTLLSQSRHLYSLKTNSHGAACVRDRIPTSKGSWWAKGVGGWWKVPNSFPCQPACQTPCQMNIIFPPLLFLHISISLIIICLTKKILQTRMYLA